MKTKQLTFLVVLVLFAVTGSSAGAAASGQPLNAAGPPAAPAALNITQPQAAAPCLPGDPFNLAALATVISAETPPSSPVTINQHIIVQFVRKAAMVSGDDSLEVGPKPRGEARPDESPVNQTRRDNVPLRIFNTRTQFEFRVSLSENLLTTIGDCHERNGLSAPGGPGTAGMIEGQLRSYLPTLFAGSRAAQSNAGTFSSLLPDGWSNNDDNRILRTPTTLWPWRTLTQSTFNASDTQSRCTMTLVGPRHLITAAHCLVNFGTTNWKARTLTPARNGQAVMPYGQTQMTPNPPPGEEAWYIVPDPWLDPNTDSTDAEEFQWDIGMVLMLDRLGDQTGWMGYNAYPASDLNNRNQLNRGYPRCDVAEAPDVGCQQHRLYGHTGYCNIGEYHHQGSNGWNREFSFDCDMSRGHSGSPLYHYRYVPSWGAQGPYVAAVVSWHECLTCTASDDFPNHARRITPWVRDALSWLKEQFP